jgi:hypothetical protein
MTLLAPTLGASRRVTRRLTALLVAGALILAGMIATAAPARAQSNDDIVRFLLGAAAIAIIIRSIDDNHRPIYISPRVLPDSCLETARVQGRVVDVYHRGCLNRAGYRNLPQHCEVSLRTHQGRRVGYEARCLYRAGYSAEDRFYHPPQPIHPRFDVLPRHCEMTYRQQGQRISGYDGRCLSDEGLRNLPRHCQVTSRDGQRLFNAQCLWDSGYRRSRR